MFAKVISNQTTVLTEWPNLHTPTTAYLIEAKEMLNLVLVRMVATSYSFTD